MAQRSNTGIRDGALVAAVFFVVAIALGGVLPLWLDEIIQLRETRVETTGQLISALQEQPGASPLGYLIQHSSLQATGYSERLARLPSALFIAGAVFVVALLSAELDLSTPWISAALFALFPLTVRYGSESRVYSQALFFSTLATLLFVRLTKNPGWVQTGLYCLALAAAVYTQPYAVFVGPAHVLWAVYCREWKVTVRAGLALIGAIVSFLPWYLWGKAHWSAGVISSDLHFSISAKTPLMLFRELVGAGYWGSGLLAILCVLVVLNRGGCRRVVSMMAILIAVPIILAIAADAATGYFIATRQIMWIMPAVAVFAGLAIGEKPQLARPAAILLVAVCVWQSIHYFTAPRENWEVAADALVSQVKQGACMEVIPKDQASSYEYFRPELASYPCPADRTVLAITPYTTTTQRETALGALTAAGYRRQFVVMAGKSEISLFSR